MEQSPQDTSLPAETTAPAGELPPPIGPSEKERNMALLAHLLGIFTGFVGPLIVWLVNKDTMPFADKEGKEALNFQITMAIAYIVGAILTLVVVGVFICAAVGICILIFGIMGSVAAKDGRSYRYPLTIRFIS